MTSKMDLSARIDRDLEQARASVTSGVEWLVQRIGPDGYPGAQHGHYYRLPWALSLAGRRAEAASVLSWIGREALDDGDLKAGDPRSAFETNWASYPLANLASGAWHLERYDTARKIVRRLHDFQHPVTGGAFAAHPAHRVDQRQDLFPTAQLGMTGLTVGDAALADGAFRWMRLIFEMQPELPGRLYTALQDESLYTKREDGAELEWQVVTDFNKPRQAFYNPGIAAAFLGRYYMATGDEEALKLARRFLDLTVSGSEVQFDFTDSVQVCKFAWGSAILFEATGEQVYLDHALRMVPWFCDSQNQDGSWDNSRFLMAGAKDPESVRVEITAEFVQHLMSLITAIGTAHRG